MQISGMGDFKMEDIKKQKGEKQQIGLGHEEPVV